METMVNDKVEWQLAVSDRCDSCGAQAYVQVTGVSGDLMFCGHHYENDEICI
jgi:hypothetical protein